MTVYNIGKTRQLIDINNDITNFNAKVTVKSTGDAPFEMAIATQAEIESGKEEYQIIEDGGIETKLNYTDNIYENYFLILRADEECECEVKIKIKDLGVTTENFTEKPKVKKSFLSGFWIKTIIICIIVAIGIGLMIYFYVKSDSMTSFSFSSMIPERFRHSVDDEPIPNLLPPEPVENILSVPETQVLPPSESSLLDKLNELNFPE